MDVQEHIYAGESEYLHRNMEQSAVRLDNPIKGKQ